MNDTFIVNKGTDLEISFNWKNEDGSNANLTGWTLFTRDVSDSIADLLSVEFSDITEGLILVKVEWANATREGRVHHFRVGIQNGAKDLTTNLMWIDVR